MLRSMDYIICGVGLLSILCVNANATASDLPDFRAKLHVIDRSKGEMYHSSVAIGKYGSRSETTHPKFGEMISIANLQQKSCRTYLVNKKAYYEETLDPKAPDCDLDLDRLFGEYADTRNTYSYHALGATTVCAGFTKRKLGSEVVNNRHTQKWECTDPATQATFSQWFDPQLGRVIKHEETKIIKEYTNIQIKPLPASLFVALRGYRKYSQNAFFDLLRIPAFSTTSQQPANLDKLLPNDRLQICMENCQAAQQSCNTAAKSEAASKRCDTAFDQCASRCEKRYPPQ
jgi:hypothetical protein